MKARRTQRSALLASAALLGLVVAAGPALSDGSPTPPTPPTEPRQPRANGDAQRQSDQQFLAGYKVAYDLVQAAKFEEALIAFRALKQDDHPDVANYIGFLSRKLGRYAEAKHWYERALAADPTHVRTWQYYGMWHVEQGNMLKAADHLATIRRLCGGEACKEFADLKGAMEGTVVY